MFFTHFAYLCRLQQPYKGARGKYQPTGRKPEKNKCLITKQPFPKPTKATDQIAVSINGQYFAARTSSIKASE
jgi:hypothetical protein